MLCRVAEEVFWLSRSIERAIAAGRLIEVTWHLELDAGEPGGAYDEFWTPLLEPAATGGVGPADDAPAPSRQDIRHWLAFASDNPNSLVSCIRTARAAARGVRESISSEMWEQLNTLYLNLLDVRRRGDAELNPYGFYKQAREGAMFFQGLADATLARDEVWLFFCLGKYLERADSVTRVLHLQAPVLLSPEALSHAAAPVRWLAVLRSCGCAEAYARHYSLRVDPARVIEFLLLNAVFPQSVLFSLVAADDALRAIAGGRAEGLAGPTPAVRALGRLRARLEHSAVDEVLEEGLKPYLEDVQVRIADVSDQVTRAYLRDEPQPGRLVGVARAAMLMAAQQQQQQ